jgi:hypothetical protein
MSQKEKENQELFDAAVQLSRIISVKGAMEDDSQFRLLGHAINTACKAIMTKEGCIHLQHHLNAFVDSIRMAKGELEVVDHLCNEEQITQN